MRARRRGLDAARRCAASPVVLLLCRRAARARRPAGSSPEHRGALPARIALAHRHARAVAAARFDHLPELLVGRTEDEPGFAVGRIEGDGALARGDGLGQSPRFEREERVALGAFGLLGQMDIMKDGNMRLILVKEITKILLISLLKN